MHRFPPAPPGRGRPLFHVKPRRPRLPATTLASLPDPPPNARRSRRAQSSKRAMTAPHRCPVDRGLRTMPPLPRPLPSRRAARPATPLRPPPAGARSRLLRRSPIRRPSRPPSSERSRPRVSRSVRLSGQRSRLMQRVQSSRSAPRLTAPSSTPGLACLTRRPRRPLRFHVKQRRATRALSPAAPARVAIRDPWRRAAPPRCDPSPSLVPTTRHPMRALGHALGGARSTEEVV